MTGHPFPIVEIKVTAAAAQVARMWPGIELKARLRLIPFNAARDVTGSPYGGQCLSFLSFHLDPGSPRKLLLTAQYRNHYYVEKLLGNMIGLGRLMSFIAEETNLKVGSLTIVSTNAEIDLPKLNGKANRQHFTDLIAACKNPPAVQSAA